MDREPQQLAADDSEVSGLGPRLSPRARLCRRCARPIPPPQRTQQVVVDGQALRGIHGEESPGIRLVALYAPEAGLVLAQAGGQDQGGAG